MELKGMKGQLIGVMRRCPAQGRNFGSKVQYPSLLYSIFAVIGIICCTRWKNDRRVFEEETVREAQEEMVSRGLHY